MRDWTNLEDFITQTQCSKKQVLELIKKQEIEAKKINGVICVREKTNALSTIPQAFDSESSALCVQESIGGILEIHSKFAIAKDETIAMLKNENEFLKNMILSIQENYSEDRSTIALLKKEIEALREEHQNLQQKYKLLWSRKTSKDES
ncbi:hypothetical protein BBW65_04230 [Helicobacter enhydrae]|uniref:DUF3972 domain-containing protein n=1 Tax=Helicobacter enhydrae TaxID=222136 RepID=A0A1B1U5I7_9HELI|nr:DUF3972 domain-containing protein [Helicobacter enhydrae]ANV98057.1 hypothetical protein BBW65_04230 [Helicobacter enhydrae]